ncbi:MAG TPA: BBP7 family outer membrane beta-barrel protein, partial [Gemmataceae bacterium]
TGFIYYDLLEKLGVSSSTSPTGTGTTLAFDDAIDTRNQYYGWQFGGRSTWTRGRLSLTMTSSIALGLTHAVVDRFGSSTLTAPGVGTVAMPGGFLVQSSNAGRITTDRFAVALPSRLMVGYQVTDHMTAFVGYDFVYFTGVARPGDQVDLVFQTNPATGTPIRPAGGMHVDDFWANSGLVGLAFKF